MLKSIFAVSVYCQFTLILSLLATASAVANPLSLFTEQCLQFQTKTAVAIPEAWLKLKDNQQPLHTLPSVPLQQIVDFESGLLSLHNLNDLNNYYRSLTNTPKYQQALLMCQVHLADELTLLAKQIDSSKLSSTANLQLGNNSPYKIYADKLASLLNRQWQHDSKALKHSLQANIEHYFSKQYQLNLPDTCQLSIQQGNEPQSHYQTEQSLAYYLAQQEDEQCRKQAWLAYQVRAKTLIQPSLLKLHQLQSEFANRHGYQNYADYQLSFQGLTSNQVDQFLASITHNINQAPWSLIQQLKQYSKNNQPKISTTRLLQQAIQQLKQLDIHFEQLESNNQQAEQQIFRVWHRQRLLGEILVNWFDESSANKASKLTGNIIKYPVLGHQFGQYSLSLPAELSRNKQQRLLTLLSEAISVLVKSGQFYYFNQLSADNSNSVIGSLWLAKWLSEQLDTHKTNDQRHELIRQYQRQQQVFRSKVALYFYQQTNQTNWPLAKPLLDTKISQAFQDSFGHDWPRGSDAIFSLKIIANQSINYYLFLWQQTLAELIFNNVKNGTKAKETFELLVVNEQNQNLYDQLSVIFQQPIDFEKLIWRISHAGTKQE